MNHSLGRHIRAADLAVLAAPVLLPATTARADPAPSRKAGFIGCLAKPDDADLGTQRPRQAPVDAWQVNSI